MKAELDCIPCMLRQTVDTVKIATNDTQKQERAIKAVLNKLHTINLEQSPPIIGKDIYQIIHEITENPDPYKAIKSENNRKALSVYPAIKKQIDKNAEPILFAAKIAAAGNTIDFGVSSGAPDIENFYKEANALQFEINHFEHFLNDIKQAKKVLYLADNAGEIVFDRIFIETLFDYSDNTDIRAQQL